MALSNTQLSPSFSGLAIDYNHTMPPPKSKSAAKRAQAARRQADATRRALAAQRKAKEDEEKAKQEAGAEEENKSLPCDKSMGTKELHIRHEMVLIVFTRWSVNNQSSLSEVNMQAVKSARHALEVNRMGHTVCTQLAVQELFASSPSKPPVLLSLDPDDIMDWEEEVFQILYEYCIHPLEYIARPDNRFIIWCCMGFIDHVYELAQHVILGIDWRFQKDKGGLRFSEFLGIILKWANKTPQEIERKKIREAYYATHDPPVLEDTTWEAFEDWSDDIRDVMDDVALPLKDGWDEDFARWARCGLRHHVELDKSIEQKGWDLTLKSNHSQPPTCKGKVLGFSDMLETMLFYLADHADSRKIAGEQSMTDRQRLERCNMADMRRQRLGQRSLRRR